MLRRRSSRRGRAGHGVQQDSSATRVVESRHEAEQSAFPCPVARRSRCIDRFRLEEMSLRRPVCRRRMRHARTARGTRAGSRTAFGGLDFHWRVEHVENSLRPGQAGLDRIGDVVICPTWLANCCRRLANTNSAAERNRAANHQETTVARSTACSAGQEPMLGWKS